MPPNDRGHTRYQTVIALTALLWMLCVTPRGHTFESCPGGGPTWQDSRPCSPAAATGQEPPQDATRGPERPAERRPAHGGPPDRARTTPRQQNRRTRRATAIYTQLR